MIEVYYINNLVLFIINQVTNKLRKNKRYKTYKKK